MNMTREPYSGAERKLLIAFDVGIAYSAVSYSILEPRRVPEIQGVHKFPGQEIAGGNAKIPTVMYYDGDGRVRAAGAETERDGTYIIAEEENWVKAEWFKLHLRPETTNSTEFTYLPPLPLGKSVVEVLSDFLTYLNNCAKQYIQEVHPGVGTNLWSGPGIHYIFPHPNGWKGPQRALMRQAAERAGLIKPEGGNQLTFIAEGGAALHRCIDSGLKSDWIGRDEGCTIVQAGGGTVDISTWASGDGGRTFTEVAESQCESAEGYYLLKALKVMSPGHLRGSVFVTEAAKKYLNEFLRGSKFHGEIPGMIQYFDRTTKAAFRDPNDPHFIRFGSERDNDTRFKIIAGKLRLDGKVIASFFEPSVECMVNGILNQRHTSRKHVSNAFLVGSFAASDYLFSRLREDLKPHGIQVFRPDTQVNKVIADGAISSILKRPVHIPATTTNLAASPPPLPSRTPDITVVAALQPSQPPASQPSLPPASQPLPLPVLSGDFDKLTDDNYHEWKIYMTAHLVRQGLLGVVDGTESQPGGTGGPKQVKKFNDKKARARAEVVLHVSPSQLVHCSHDDPALIWNAIATAHAVRKRVTINSLHRQLRRLCLEPNETMSAFIGRARHMAFLIKEAGGDASDEDIILSLTTGLPSSYDSCITFLDTLPDSDYNLDAVSARLIGEYQRQITTAHPTPRTLYI